jgi:hypothetical protein
MHLPYGLETQKTATNWCSRTITASQYSSSSSSVGATARCGLWPVKQYLSICPYLSPTLSIFLLPTHEDLFPLLLFILSWVFLFVSALPVLEWRSFWASYLPPFSPGDPANLSFAPLSILLYFLVYSTLLVRILVALDKSLFLKRLIAAK